MAYCTNCGREVVDGAQFCGNCGGAVRSQNLTKKTEREVFYEGEIRKCPNCGEVLKSFMVNCPACGFEFRGVQISSAVKEFALKLEEIESNRKEKSRGMFSAITAQQFVSKTDEQKISLIKSFTVPNTKEDMLEFMILATSSINMRAYDSTNTNASKSEKELNSAWLAKVQQVYEKAKRLHSSEDVFAEIKKLYDECMLNIRSTKKKGVVKWILMFIWIPIFIIVILISVKICSPISEQNEVDRLESIVAEIELQIEAGEYKYALMNAEGLVYKGSVKNEEQERQWKIEREYWIDKIIEEAAKNGVALDRPTESEVYQEYSESNSNEGGFIEGFIDGVQNGLDDVESNTQ